MIESNIRIEKTRSSLSKVGLQNAGIHHWMIGGGFGSLRLPAGCGRGPRNIELYMRLPATHSVLAVLLPVYAFSLEALLRRTTHVFLFDTANRDIGERSPMAEVEAAPTFGAELKVRALPPRPTCQPRQCRPTTDAQPL